MSLHLVFFFFPCLVNFTQISLSQGLVNNLISVGFGREAAFSAAVLGDNTLMEKAWQETGMLAEAVLHAHVQPLNSTLSPVRLR